MGLIGKLAYDKTEDLEKEIKKLKKRIEKIEKQINRREDKVYIPPPANYNGR